MDDDKAKDLRGWFEATARDAKLTMDWAKEDGFSEDIIASLEGILIECRVGQKVMKQESTLVRGVAAGWEDKVGIEEE